MASLTRPTKATYVSHEDVTIDTLDHQDHTFCGVMFPLRIKEDFPVDRILLKSISVRGRLGPMTVWIDEDNGSDASSEGRKKYEQLQRYGLTWNKIYDKVHLPSMKHFCELTFAWPLSFRPGEIRTIYIHSSDLSDKAVVYDNAREGMVYQDDMISITVGKAHLSTTPFGNTSIWGYPGAWRDNRAFVGQLHYGIVYKLWNPQTHTEFNTAFDRMVLTLLLCQRRYESPVSLLPDDCLYYILNMCTHNWPAPYNNGNNNNNSKTQRLLASLKEGLHQKSRPLLPARRSRRIQRIPSSSSSSTQQSNNDGDNSSSNRRRRTSVMLERLFSRRKGKKSK